MRSIAINRKALVGVWAMAWVLASGLRAASGEGLPELERNFASPPHSARPWAHWFWVDGNVTREGITADLEAMARVGIGGLVLMDVSQEVPPGTVAFLGKEWRELFTHTLNEAERLGLEVSMNNGPGWTGSGGPWITPNLAMQRLVSSKVNVTGPGKLETVLPKLPTWEGTNWDVAVVAFPARTMFRIPELVVRSGMARGTLNPMPTNVPASAIVPAAQVRELTKLLGRDGKLVWDAPPGEWTILRLGSMPTGRMNNPARPGGFGLETDKLSREATRAHFNGMLGRLIAENDSKAGRTLTFTHTDSWEVRFQNWTPRFREEFEALRGYDPLPYLPTMAGQVVESLAVTERFLWDVRRTIADLQAKNYAGELTALAHQHGMKLSAEAYGNGPFDSLLYAAEADVPMSEFWNQADDYANFHTSKTMASVAHVYGKPIVAAEAFTAWPVNAAWRNHPFSLKPLGDAAFAYGVNRIVFHRFAHQPWLNLKPGMTLSMWGVHYERTQTWWNYSKPWHEYVARCQYLLRQGTFVADVCCVTDETAYAEPPGRTELGIPEGYDYDVVSPQAFLSRFSATNGLVHAQDGMSYRLIVLPGTRQMTPALLRKTEELLAGGANIIGARPTNSPSLSQYPQCDAEVAERAARIWGECDGNQVKQNRVGPGRIIWGKTVQQVLAALGAEPDFRVPRPAPKPFRYIHRRLDAIDCYFVANPATNAVAADCEFRVSGRQPEFWHPDTGTIERPARCRQAGSNTVVHLSLDAGGSVFVMFRQTAADPVGSVLRDGAVDDECKVTLGATGSIRLETEKAGAFEFKRVSGAIEKMTVKSLPAPITLTGAWEVSFPPGLGAPAAVTLRNLAPLNEQREPGIRCFSGAATYRKTITIPPAMLGDNQRIYLDLGLVRYLAEVRLNGKSAGILWKPPFVIDVTGLVRSGTNDLEVTVVNMWVNRLIGDEQLPADCEWTGDDPGAVGNALARWPEWLLKNEPRPTGRVTFATRRFWGKDSPLMESGLIGPVSVRVAAIASPK